MSLLGLLLLILCLYFVVRPLLRVWKAYSKIKQGDLSGLGDIFGQPGSQKGNSARNPDGSRKAGWTKPVFKKKKISSDTGEYVNFTEVPGSTGSDGTEAGGTGQQHTSYTAESQITDIEWEEVK